MQLEDVIKEIEGKNLILKGNFIKYSYTMITITLVTF